MGYNVPRNSVCTSFCPCVCVGVCVSACDWRHVITFSTILLFFFFFVFFFFLPFVSLFCLPPWITFYLWFLCNRCATVCRYLCFCFRSYLIAVFRSRSMSTASSLLFFLDIKKKKNTNERTRFVNGARCKKTDSITFAFLFWVSFPFTDKGVTLATDILRLSLHTLFLLLGCKYICDGVIIIRQTGPTANDSASSFFHRIVYFFSLIVPTFSSAPRILIATLVATWDFAFPSSLRN